MNELSDHYPRDEDSWERAVTALAKLSLGQVLALTNYLANDLSVRLQRESLLQNLYSRAERLVVHATAAAHSANTIRRSEVLQVSDDTAVAELRSRLELGPSEFISFEAPVRAPSGAAFGLAKWIRELPSVTAYSEKQLLTSLSWVTVAMHRDAAGLIPYRTELMANARLLVHATSAAAVGEASKMMSLSRTMALASSIAVHREPVRVDLSDQIAPLLKLYEEYPEILTSDKRHAWARDVESRETMLGLSLARLDVIQPRLHPEVPCSAAEFWQKPAPRARRTLLEIGRHEAKRAFVSEVAEELEIDDADLREAGDEFEVMEDQIDRELTGRSIVMEMFVDSLNWGRN